jgi:deoxyuridine 5'-triphosphate nucleotidohydrolase
MIDPYLTGCLIHFSLSQDEDGIFTVHDSCCTLEQLYTVNNLYRSSLTTKNLILSLQTSETTSRIVYGSKGNSFRCVYGPYFKQLSWIPFETPTDNWSYISGILDMNATLQLENQVENAQLVLRIYISSKDFMNALNEYIQIPCDVRSDYLEYRSTNVMDLFHLVKEGTKKQQLQTLLQGSIFPVCKVVCKHPDAVFPFKSRLSDVGYDLTVICKHKDLTSNTALYDTGIALEIPFKYYAEIAPRSSLSKSGYMLTNSIGIIDPGYKGNLYIALTKVSPEVGEISFPFRCGQLIFKQQVFVDLVETFETEESTRGQGGYGSTG